MSKIEKLNFYRTSLRKKIVRSSMVNDVLIEV